MSNVRSALEESTLTHSHSTTPPSVSKAYLTAGMKRKSPGRDGSDADDDAAGHESDEERLMIRTVLVESLDDNGSSTDEQPAKRVRMSSPPSAS